MVSGRVVDSQGQPIAGVHVLGLVDFRTDFDYLRAAAGAGGRGLTSLTDARGRFTAGALRASYRIDCFGRFGRRTTMEARPGADGQDRDAARRRDRRHRDGPQKRVPVTSHDRDRRPHRTEANAPGNRNPSRAGSGRGSQGGFKSIRPRSAGRSDFPRAGVPLRRWKTSRSSRPDQARRDRRAEPGGTLRESCSTPTIRSQVRTFAMPADQLSAAAAAVRTARSPLLEEMRRFRDLAAALGLLGDRAADHARRALRAARLGPYRPASPPTGLT